MSYLLTRWHGVNYIQSMTFTQRILADIQDSTERALVAEVWRLGSELDAATDGALHHAHGSDADRMLDTLHYRYGQSINALADYRDQKGS